MVLLLDDDDGFRRSLAHLLRDDGYNVLDYSNPGHVPPLNTLAPVTALIVDYEMASESGISFADRFHAAHPDAPVILVTANVGRGLDRQLYARSWIMLWRKPFSYDQLAATLPAPKL